MALKTINDLTALTTPASTDLVGVWAVGAARMRKSTIGQTFSPMLAVANVFTAKQTLDALLALKKNVAPGTTSGYLELGTNAGGDLVVQNDGGAARTLAGSISGGGTVATAGFTLTVPATGTAALAARGTWTPGISADGTAPTPVFISQLGFYERIGNLVYISFLVETSGISGGTGNVLLTDLPFAHDATAGSASTGAVSMKLDWSASKTNVIAYISAGQNYIQFLELQDNTGPSLLPLAAWGATSFVQGSIVYKTA